MKSIRLALIVYFLVLLAGALGAVSWFVYQTTSQTLRAKEVSVQDHLRTQFKYDEEGLKSNLDKKLVRHAQTLASLARLSRPHLETLYPLGTLGAVLQPNGYLGVPLWLAGGFYLPLAWQLNDIYRPPHIRIEAAGDVMPALSEGQPREFFQTFHSQGRSLERSPAMGTASFRLDEKLREKTARLREVYDDAELPSGVKVRRVTLMANVTRFGPNALPPLWRFRPDLFRFVGPPKVPPRRWLGGEKVSPVFFIQYACETSTLENRLGILQAKLETDLKEQERETALALAGLRSRLGWIIGLTFLAVLAGGYWLVRLGLTPLERLSDAVSRVSEKDFRLQVEEKKLPAELRPIVSRLEQTLEQLKRAFAREKQAAADISHELRTPLAALLTTLDVTLRKPRSPEEYQEALEECRQSGQQMTQLVERLLALARLDAGADHLRLQEVDVANLACKCADLVRPLADARGLDLRVHVQEPTLVRTDPDKLREVLNNLLYNAIEYNRPHGSIDLEVERHNGDLALQVKDTGIGIPPEAREHIFERFFRADPSRHADTLHAGIGLAIVKGYVDLMGGTIGVDSGVGGSTFRVRFPMKNH